VLTSLLDDYDTYSNCTHLTLYLYVCTALFVEFYCICPTNAQKETAIDQQQHNCETLICQRHQTVLGLLSSAAMVSTRWRVRELYCPTTYFTISALTLNYSRCCILYTNISYFCLTSIYLNLPAPSAIYPQLDSLQRY
jgi:hypothetical protein